MEIDRVELSDFRNYRTLSLTPAPHLNVLAGPNAQGKTNLLEGLGVLLVGRSFRGAKAADMLGWGAASALVGGEIRRGETVRAIRRAVVQRDDGRWGVGGEGCPWARAIGFGWQDLAILTEGPHARRNFIDGFAGKLYAAHLSGLGRYRQIVARRNRLLQGGLAGPALRNALAPWNAQLVRVGLELMLRRRAAVEALQAEARGLYPTLAGAGAVRLQYCAALGPEAGEAEFLAVLEARVPEEARRGQTLVGPHRDDLLIEVDDRDLRVYGSRGQQRLMALTLRLAEVGPVARAVGSAPVLLLDDALSELDPAVQARVLDHVSAAGQVFLTTADASLPDVRRVTWWDVRGGRVTEPMLSAVRGAA
ncbi:MAG TPA: DNA replication and repair protein RecF [Candidatus Limnocylindria bacterium]|nr:DNA replication and repair protein RecF [Candidatus Limnocylindria bacterium]